MTLTDEQKERIRQNRERALAIQRERAAQLQEEQAAGDNSSKTMIAKGEKSSNREDDEGTATQSTPKKRAKDDDGTNRCEGPGNKQDQTTKTSTGTPADQRSTTQKKQRTTNEESLELEDFEIGASDFVTRQDAMKLYCLPAGTLEVCQYIERPNPRNSSWKPMRLYHRSEIRERAHRRFGGLKGLVQERQNRANKRLSVDMEKAKKLFR